MPMLLPLPLSLFSSLLLLPLLSPLLTSNFAGFDQGQQTWNGEAGVWACTTHSHHRDGQCGSPSKRNIQDALDASNPTRTVLDSTEQLGEEFEYGSRRRRRSAADRAKAASKGTGARPDAGRTGPQVISPPVFLGAVFPPPPPAMPPAAFGCHLASGPWAMARPWIHVDHPRQTARHGGWVARWSKVSA